MLSQLAISSVLGAAIGLSLGALGGGGSILTVPALVYALNVNAKSATGASLLIVGLSALFGTFAHHRYRRVRWKIGLSIGVVSIVGSIVGTLLNRLINPDLLLLIFSLLMFTVATVMARRGHKSTHESTPLRTASLVNARSAGSTRNLDLTDRNTGTVLVETPSREHRPSLIILVGIGVGFLTGFLGVGGGFIVVPALILALNFQLPEAVGTSLLVIFLSSAFAIAERGGVHHISDAVVIPFAVSAMVAALVGNALATRIPAQKLNRGFIALIICVAVYVGIRSVIGLS